MAAPWRELIPELKIQFFKHAVHEQIYSLARIVRVLFVLSPPAIDRFAVSLLEKFDRESRQRQERLIYSLSLFVQDG